MIQKHRKYFLRIHRLHFPVLPIFFCWNLSVEQRLELTNIFAFFLPDFCNHLLILMRLGVIQHIKTYTMSFALQLGKYAVFLFIF